MYWSLSRGCDRKNDVLYFPNTFFALQVQRKEAPSTDKKKKANKSKVNGTQNSLCYISRGYTKTTVVFRKN